MSRHENDARKFDAKCGVAGVYRYTGSGAAKEGQRRWTERVRSWGTAEQVSFLPVDGERRGQGKESKGRKFLKSECDQDEDVKGWKDEGLGPGGRHSADVSLPPRPHHDDL